MAQRVQSVHRRKDGPYTPENWQARYLDAVARRFGRYLAAEEAGIAYKTVQRERDRNPEFAEAEHEALERLADRNERDLDDNYQKSGNPVNKIVLLKKLRPQEYIERHAIQTTTVNVELSLSGQDAREFLRSMVCLTTDATAKEIGASTVLEAHAQHVEPDTGP